MENTAFKFSCFSSIPEIISSITDLTISNEGGLSLNLQPKCLGPLHFQMRTFTSNVLPYGIVSTPSWVSYDASLILVITLPVEDS